MDNSNPALQRPNSNHRKNQRIAQENLRRDAIRKWLYEHPKDADDMKALAPRSVKANWDKDLQEHKYTQTSNPYSPQTWEYEVFDFVVQEYIRSMGD